MKNTLIGLGVVALLIIGVYLVFSGLDTSGATGDSIDPSPSGESQSVVLSQDGYNYNDVYAQTGKSIKISADSSVGGCLRSVAFNIDGRRYLKYLKTPQDTLELPALNPGTYTFSCSMGMGFGNLIVE